MAQKRAPRGRRLNAVAGSALFIADLDDNQPPAAENKQPPEPPPPMAANVVPDVPGTAELEARTKQACAQGSRRIPPLVRAAGLVWPPGTPAALKRMVAEAAKIEAAAAEEKETYEGGNEVPIRRERGRGWQSE